MTTALLELAEGQNDRRNNFMINLHKSMWPPDWGLNQWPLDWQSDLLPTALGGLADTHGPYLDQSRLVQKSKVGNIFLTGNNGKLFPIYYTFKSL